MIKNSKKYFEDIANQWNDIRHDLFPDNLSYKITNIIDTSKNNKAADIGAGTGFITGALLEKGVSVTAIDQSNEMLSVLKTKYSKYQNLKTHVADGDNLPLNDESVNYVFANMYLHHVENPQKAINEMWRILAPKGVIVISDLDKHNFTFLQKEQFDRWLGFNRDDIETWFKQAGFTNIKIECANENCCSQSKTNDSHAKISIFIASGEKIIKNSGC